MGPSEIEIIRRTLINQAASEEAIEFFLADYEKNHEAMVEHNQEIADLLHDLQDAGIGLALFTGKSRRTLDISLAKLDWNVSFDKIVTGDDVIRSKPSPEGIEQILDSLKWNREETDYVRDSSNDMLAGRDAGIRTLAAQWMTIVQDQEYKATLNQQFHTLDSFRSYLANRITSFK